MTKERLERVNQVLAKRQPDLTVLLDGVHKPHNIAAIIRSCDAVGVLDIHMAKPGCGFGRHHMTSGGTQKWMKIHHHQQVIEGIQYLKQRGFQVLASNLSDQAIPFQAGDYTKPTAFMMGAELFGVNRDVLDQVDGEVYIPMMGMVESLNVSVACAILLSEAQRQRQEAGHYQTPKLTVQQIAQLRFEWLHGPLARHYQEEGKAYPPLDEDGDVCF